jgi:hypothetical protein
MKSSTILLAACISAMSMLTPAPSTALAEELFRDDFEGNEIDPVRWTCLEQHWAQGQTWFVGCPDVSGGIATFEHHTYNPLDPGNSCVSQSIRSNILLSRNDHGLEVEARMRLRPETVGCGLVAAFFLYMQEEVAGHTESDEIDFEFLSNSIVWPPGCGGHRVFVVTYDDFWGQWGHPCYHYEGYPLVPGLNLTEFNVFKIRWCGDRINWYWDPTPGSGADDDVLIYTAISALADQPMNLYFNFWAATEIWPAAWCPDTVPVNEPALDSVYYYDVDYVVVRSKCRTCPGDMDGSGVVDFQDVDEFVTGLLSVPLGPCADVNEDDHASGLDIQLFVNSVLACEGAGTPCD